MVVLSSPIQPTAEMPAEVIKITGARQHNLRNLTLEIPREKLVVITGMSGSGKSSLAFDTLYAEGQRRYVESLSAYARQFMARMNKPDVDYIKGLCPAIAIEQKVITRTPRSTTPTERDAARSGRGECCWVFLLCEFSNNIQYKELPLFQTHNVFFCSYGRCSGPPGLFSKITGKMMDNKCPLNVR